MPSFPDGRPLPPWARPGGPFPGGPGGPFPGGPFPGGPGFPGLDFPVPKADVSHISRKWLDLAYAPTSPTQRLDIYLPQGGDGPFPVILFIHGGGFAIGDKADIQLEPFLAGLERGFAVVSVNYRLSGEAIFPAGLQDVKAAIRWLRVHSAEYRLDSDRIAACGGSSGGNYAAMMGVTDGVALFHDPALGNADLPERVQAVVDWFGPTDFLQMDGQLAASGLEPRDHGTPFSPESQYLGAPIAEVPDLVRQANPMMYVGDAMPPFLIQHGTMDVLVPVQQSVEFARVIHARVGEGRAQLVVFDGAGHDDPVFSGADNMERVFAFLEEHLN